jgi:hypothetical protein
MSKHTPGPWEPKTNTQFKWVESPFHTVCVFYQWNSDGSFSESTDAEANARLIAAAPEMIAALEMIVAAHAKSVPLMGQGMLNQQKEDWLKAAIAALAKARGET